jgi:hypothetical protein
MTDHILLYDQVYTFYDMIVLAYINTIIFGLNRQYLHGTPWFTDMCGGMVKGILVYSEN